MFDNKIFILFFFFEREKDSALSDSFKKKVNLANTSETARSRKKKKREKKSCNLRKGYGKECCWCRYVVAVCLI